jgi:hypothetical protein
MFLLLFLCHMYTIMKELCGIGAFYSPFPCQTEGFGCTYVSCKMKCLLIFDPSSCLQQYGSEAVGVLWYLDISEFNFTFHLCF